MRIVGCWVAALALVGCSDDTKPPVDSAVGKAEAKVGDGPAVKTEGGTADKGGVGKEGGTTDKGGGAKDGAATGIGPAGGQAKSPDGFFTLDIPAGALSSTVVFDITKPMSLPPAGTVATWTEVTGAITGSGKVTAKISSTSCLVVLETMGATKTVKAAYQVKPHGTSFASDATITFLNLKLTDAGYKVFKHPQDCPLPM
jgi:hypothetical protein